jgi:Tol biopolymer transport system component/CubicO group peptidase (beta-lactamase class C family)
VRPRRLLATGLVLALMAGCVGPTPEPDPEPTVGPTPFGCDETARDPSRAFYTPTDVAFHDGSPLDWPTGSPSDAGLDPALLDRAAENAALSPEVRSLLVVRHGKLVYERYFNGSDPSLANNVASVSKSILSLATGIAIEDGLLALDTPIGELLPAEVVGEHGDLTIEQLLTMSAGLELRDPEYDYDGGDSFVKAVLARPSAVPAGTEFAYSTGLTQVLATVLTKVAGTTLCRYVTDRLLAPLGIDVEQWWIEPEGVDAGGHSVFITPREIARIGQLVLQDGTWDGRQLVPKAWLDLTLAERWDLGCRGVRPVHFGYGYLWWPLDVDGHLVWQASGYGSQQLWIVPDMDLVVVMTHDAASVGDPARQEVNDYELVRTAIFPNAPAPSSPRCAPFVLAPFSMKPDGTSRTALAGWPENALPWSWSPDGQRIALGASNLDLNGEIYTASPDGTDLVRLTYDLAFDNLPAWSPDGSTIAFVRGAPASTDLYLVAPDGSGLAQLTNFDGFESSPTWSPDGRAIAFVWGHGDVRGFGADAPLWVMAANGSSPRLLLDRPIGYPMWSPDGRSIAVELRGKPSRIGILDVRTRVLTELRQGYAPRWSPDGTRLVFLADSNETTDIFTMNIDGSDVVQLTDDAAFDTFPMFTPDGRSIRFLTRQG